MASSVDIPFNAIATTTDEKKQILRDFFSRQGTGADGYTNSSKFLFLFGEENTGKLDLIKEIAQEVFGDTWESKLYIREDKGQKYPYKLHAHKVESSRKVLILTNLKDHWQKWRELYPHTQAFFFTGIYVSPAQLLTENLPANFRTYDIDLFKQTLRDTIHSFFVEKTLPGELSMELQRRITANVNEMLYA